MLLYDSPELLCVLFFTYFWSWELNKKIRLGLQRQEAKRRYEENGETPLQAALHARQQQAIAVGGIAAAEAICDRAVKQRDESIGRTASANRTCKTALGMYSLQLET